MNYDFVPLTLDILLCCVILLLLVADLLLPSGEKRGLGAFAAASLVGLLVASFFLDIEGEAFSGAYATDAMAMYLKRIFLAAGALGVLGAIDTCDRDFPVRQGEYYLLLLCSVLGMSLLAGARELVFLAVSFELMGIPLYVLAAIARRDERDAEAALKLYLVGAASSAITLYGLSILYGTAGTTVIADLSEAGPSALMRMGLVATLAGMGFKIGMVPFHMWIPDTYEGAPTPFVAFLSVAPKAAGFAALVRLLVGGLLPFQEIWLLALLIICGATMVVGNLIAIPQRNVKRLLAGSGVAHIGYMLLAFAVGTEKGIGLLLFYLLAYVFTNMGAFLVQSEIGRHGTDDIEDFDGLHRRAPGLALAMLLFLLSLGGIPFVAGFWAKLYIFMAAWEAGQGLLVFMGAALAVVALFYYLKVARAMYIQSPSTDDEGRERIASIPLTLPAATAIVVAGIGVVGMGVYPRLFVEPALHAAAQLMRGGL